MFEIVVGTILVVIGWIEFAYAKLMRYKREARNSWPKLEALIKARSGAILKLLEKVAEKGIFEEEMEKLFDQNGGFIDSRDREKVSEAAELSTPTLYSLLEKLKPIEELKDEVDEILEMNDELEVMSKTYNESIKNHNNIIDMKKYKYQILLLNPEKLKDFDINRYMN